MAKRKKWSVEEDTILREIVASYEGDYVNWNEVSQRMEQRGFSKASRQVRERWSNHLDPKLEQESLKTEDDRRLLDLHVKHGNSWKTIAKSFKGRSDNRIKNQFFSMIRKALRNARRCLRKSSNTEQINSIKPWVLSKFINEVQPMPSGVFGGNPAFPWSTGHHLKMREFVEFFLINKYSKFESFLDDAICRTITWILEYVKKMNTEYCKESKKQIGRRKKITKRDKALQRKAKEARLLKSAEPKPALVEVAFKQDKKLKEEQEKKPLSAAPSIANTEKVKLRHNPSEMPYKQPREEDTVRFRRSASDQMSQVPDFEVFCDKPPEFFRNNSQDSRVSRPWDVVRPSSIILDRLYDGQVPLRPPPGSQRSISNSSRHYTKVSQCSKFNLD